MPKWKREKLVVKKTPLFPKVFFSLFSLLLLLISGYFLQPLKLWQQYQDYQKLTLAKDLVNATARFYKIFGFFPWEQNMENNNFAFLSNLVNQGILPTNKAKQITKLKAFYVIKSENLPEVEVCFAPISAKYQAKIGHWCGKKETQSSLAAASDFHEFSLCEKTDETQLICFSQTEK